MSERNKVERASAAIEESGVLRELNRFTPTVVSTILVGFDTDEAYAVYVEHANHVELVDKWRPRLSSLLVRDILDDRPTARSPR